MLVHHETLIQYFTDRHFLNDPVNKQKKHLKHLVGPTIEVEVPLCNGAIPATVLMSTFNLLESLYTIKAGNAFDGPISGVGEV